MTKDRAAAVVKALNDIEDFEIFMEQVEMAYHNTEGDIADFFESKMMPLMNIELARRNSILTAM